MKMLIFSGLILFSIFSHAQMIARDHSCGPSDMGDNWRECQDSSSDMTITQLASILTCDQMQDPNDSVCTDGNSVVCQLLNVRTNATCSQEVRGLGNGYDLCNALVACMNSFPGCSSGCQGKPHGDWEQNELPISQPEP